MGPNILFPYGLAVGVCAAIVNLNIISVSIDRAVERGRRGPVIIGFIIRILLYAGAFWLAVRTSGISGLGAAIGFLLPRVTMYVRHVFMPWLRRRLGKEPLAVYRTDTKSNVFVKEPWSVRYNKGRAYKTFRHYKKVRVVQEPGKAKESGNIQKAGGTKGLKKVMRKAAEQRQDGNREE